MPKALPPQPHIDWLKKTAKERLATLREHESAGKAPRGAGRGTATSTAFRAGVRSKRRSMPSSLDGQIIAAAKQGRAHDLDKLLTAASAEDHDHREQLDLLLLHIVAAQGHRDCVDVLIRHGFDIATRDTFDNATALHWAAQMAALDIVRRLIDAGADVDGEGDEAPDRRAGLGDLLQGGAQGGCRLPARPRRQNRRRVPRSRSAVTTSSGGWSPTIRSFCKCRR